MHPRHHHPFPVAAGMKLLGEILTWTCNGVTVRHRDLIEALRESDLEESVARELAPRHAFSRACKKLARDRIIRQVAEDESTLTFQFTQESRREDKYEYTMETLLVLDKESGKVTCELAGLATLAQEKLDEAIVARTGGDVTRIVQKLFDRQADLFAIRPQGGCYFVPVMHTVFIDKIQCFLGKLNGQLLRFPVPAGTSEGDRSVKEAVTSGLAAMIEEHRAAIALFGEDTRESTLERAAERIRVTRHKLSAYAEYLADERAKLEAQLTLAAGELRARIAALSEAGNAVAS
ncbi:MAG: DUF6744 family protein [Gemmataceae bacterium]